MLRGHGAQLFAGFRVLVPFLQQRRLIEDLTRVGEEFRAVNAMPWEERVKISMPSSFSSSFTEELNAGWDTYSSCEASFMEPHSTILTMYFS